MGTIFSCIPRLQWEDVFCGCLGPFRVLSIVLKNQHFFVVV